MAAAEFPVPDGFTRVQRRSPFLDLLGELHVLDDDGQPVYGLRIRPEHANNRGAAHGGVLMTLADLVLGYTTAFASDPPLPLTTASMSVDFVGAAQVGEWLEGRAEIVRTGRSLAFATCYLTVGDRRVVRASSVLAVGATPLSGRPPR
ncbi:MAG: PaaI family thioesterase [Pseudonocardia sp.]|nr:PaaI family thioesterase [Pseudonocardia sp.]